MNNNYPNEEWRTISDAPDYSVSNYGRVQRTALSVDKPTGKAKLGMVLKPATNNSGYLRVTLRADGWAKIFTVHSLVAAAFIGERPEGWHINHIDGDKTNNRADNLAYISAKDNIKHAYATGLVKPRKGARNTVLTKEQRAEVLQKYQAGGVSYRSLATEYNVHYRTIQSIVTGRTSKKDGVDLRRKLSDLDIQHMRGWHKCGFSVVSIAKEYQINYPHAWHIINDVPVKRRKPQGGNQ